jgi:hypothetical protein
MSSPKELWDSLSEFVWGILRRFYYWSLAFLVDPFDFYGTFLKPYFNQDIVLPSDWFPYLFGFGIVCAAIHTYHELRLRKGEIEKKYEEVVSRRLEIEFREETPFKQEQPLTDSHGNQGVQKLYRIGVRNVSGATINRVQVKLENIRPSTNIVCPVPLHIMNDNPSDPDQLRKEFALDADQIEYVDVVLKDEWSISSGHPMQIAHTVQGLPFHISPRGYELTVVAHGEGAMQARKTFIAKVNKQNRLLFRPKNSL